MLSFIQPEYESGWQQAAVLFCQGRASALRITTAAIYHPGFSSCKAETWEETSNPPFFTCGRKEEKTMRLHDLDSPDIRAETDMLLCMCTKCGQIMAEGARGTLHITLMLNL
eukprot:1160585-Pelagomonas_calceolata.AAC.4